MSSSDAPLGSFEEQVLLAVVRTGDDAYGMQVRREIEEATDRDVSIGAVYSTLDRLEDKGLLESHRGRPGDRRRAQRFFRITDAGVAALGDSRDVRQRLWDGVDLRRLGWEG